MSEKQRERESMWEM